LKGEVLEGELAVAAAQEREESEQMDTRSRQINHLPPAGVLAKDRSAR